ncbi:hypothetical protein K2173_001898 [Erythroxylum novogranatense]|uniref:protein-serine/threonine phosphatase n=1 Tax=Erythroxylum novogranatense TaxID=1862640 RepID=A0AAV8SP28_9ROSI|nr:hypothetical protein K2173_001898 [Erythroxylum novogranatense]
MGNAIAKVSHCFDSGGGVSRRHDIAVYLGDSLYEGLGHTFCYVRPEPARLSNSKIHCEDTPTTFRSISGASVSANTSTPPSAALISACSNSSGLDRASTFESTDSFASIPLQPVPRGQLQNGSGALFPGGSGPIERGFLSGPIERGFLSGPIDRGVYSGPIEKARHSLSLESIGDDEMEDKPKKQSLVKTLRRVISNTITRGHRSISDSMKGGRGLDTKKNGESGSVNVSGSSANLSGQVSLSNDVDGDSEFSVESQNVHWAQGKAGEDRVHIVISEEHGWVFMGIYDGFNGPDAPDYLLSNLYNNVHKELKGLLWSDKLESTRKENMDVKMEDCLKRKQGKNLGYRCKGVAERRKESQRMWRCEWDRERLELDWKLKEQFHSKTSTNSNGGGINHSDVLKALSQALVKTEEAYMEVADNMASENPELALMGSCVLVMLMKGEDVYLMNVGDSRAVLAHKSETNLGIGTASQDLEIIREESGRDFELFDGEAICRLQDLNSLQLTTDHSTYVDKEVQRIRKEHPDDASAVINDRVKGYLKVTRAFGVGFLKQPKWNDLLLEMFRIDYIGTAPYITCLPSLFHHRLTQKDRFLILSSDGLYQYFTNDEVVSVVDSFLAAFPEGDPAQYLIEEVLFRAAKKAGMDFHELLDIPQGERRRYHDDVSVIVISLEGRIWRSSV